MLEAGVGWGPRRRCGKNVKTEMDRGQIALVELMDFTDVALGERDSSW